MSSVRAPTTPEEAGLRIDKWLWHARFFKSRSLAAKFVAGGYLRSDGTRVSKAHHLVRVGQVLTFSLHDQVRVIRVLALGVRRGPAVEARTLYDDLDPPAKKPPSPPGDPVVARREPGTGRPTKRQRRAIDRLTNRQ